jgi:cell division protein FtsZ
MIQSEIPMPGMGDAEMDLSVFHQTYTEEPKAEQPKPVLQQQPLQPKEEKEPPVHLQLKIREEKETSEFDREKKELEIKKQQLDDRFEKLRQSILSGTGTAPGAPPAGPDQHNSQHPNPSSAASGGYLSRPSNIYAENKRDVNASRPAEEPLPKPAAKMESDETFDMQLVIRNDIPAAEEPLAHQTQQPVRPQAEEPAPQDNAEEQKRRAADRLQKLRNLSFNVNAADPNNEFETVPAYIRRNMELFNNSSSVEDFYSNYTVKSDGKNGSQISTINTFLDGKKPD